MSEIPEVVKADSANSDSVAEDTSIEKETLDDELCGVLDSTTKQDDASELNDSSSKEIDGGNESDEGDESPTERGKFKSERVIEQADSNTIKPRSVERVDGTRKKLNQGPFKRNLRFGRRIAPRPRYMHQNRLRHPMGNATPRPHQPFIQPNFNHNVPFPQMPGLPIYANNANIPNMTTLPQYPMQQQFIINQTPFQNPYIINQIQIPSQISHMQTIIANQSSCGFAQLPMQINNMNQNFALQQTNVAMQMPPNSYNNYTVTTSNVEGRKVLINPHFKGRIMVQDGLMNSNERQKLDDIELLRQQEEFIDQNRRNLQKRMHPSRYSNSPEIDYRSSTKSRSYHSSYHRKSYNNHNVSKSLPQKNKIEEVIEDNETREYRKRIEEQNKKREMYLKQKEERRRQRMHKEESQVDSTVKEPLENMENKSELHINDSKHSEEIIHNRLNKPVHRTGVLNLKTGLIKPKAKVSENVSVEAPSSHFPPKVIVKVDSDTKRNEIKANSTSEPNCADVSASQSNTSKIALSTEVSVDNSEKNKEKLPKAGFLGRRLVIASNVSQRIVVKAENSEKTIEEKPIGSKSGLFSNVPVNQEFSDDEDLSFLDIPI